MNIFREIFEAYKAEKFTTMRKLIDKYRFEFWRDLPRFLKTLEGDMQYKYHLYVMIAVYYHGDYTNTA